MNWKNNVHFTKPIFLALILGFSILSVGLFVPMVLAAHPAGNDSVSRDLVVGANTIAIRNINNPNGQVDANGDSIATVSVNFLEFGKATLKVTDADANLDSEGIDVVLSSLTSTTSGTAKAETQLFEDGPNTGTFTGTVILSSGTTTGNQLQFGLTDDFTPFYDPEPEGVGRASLNLLQTIINPGANAVVKDFIIDQNRVFSSCANSGFDIYTHPTELQMSNSAALGISVTIATTNAVGIDPAIFNTNFLKVLYRPPGGTWESLTPNGNLAGHNITPGTIIGTITNVDQPSTAPGNLSGQYAIGAQIGCAGGGGGGLVKAGLVVNALAGAGVLSAFFGGGGGGGPSAPTITSSSFSSESNPSFTQLGQGGSSGGVISIQDLDDSSGPISIQTNDPINLTFDLYENQGINNVEHVTMYFFQGDTTGLSNGEIVSKSDTKILFDRGQSVHVTDPHGYFANAEFDLSATDAWNLEINYYITFAKPMETTSLLIRSWDLDRNTGDKLLVNAIKVVETSFLDVPTGITSQESSITQTELDIPLWVKNNAEWWYQKQIDDSDFVAGIEYMISENIINVPQTEVSDSTSSEIPDWLRDVAGFWANDSISDAEFVQSIQWMITNGVLVVV